MKKIIRIKGFVLALILLVSAAVLAEGQKEVSDTAAEKSFSQAKYVFLFVGDGMAMPQINAAEAYLNEKNGSDIGIKQLNFTQFPAQGLTTTYDAGSFITDSASAGTAIATGNKTLSGVINMDVSKTIEYPTIAEMAKAAGKKVGIISSVDLDHATPACFYAHQPTRNNYYEIGVQAVNSDVDYFGGGNFRMGKTPEGKPTVHDLMAKAGWTMAGSKSDLNSISGGVEKVYAYTKGFAGDALPYDLDRTSDEISLAEFTAKGIELLDNQEGFFIMVEGGKIDWACHANDAASSIHDTIAFDNAVAEAIKFYNQHPEETLIIVTGDHETGGLALGFAGTKYASAFEKIDGQSMSHEAFDKYVIAPYKASHNAADARLSDLIPEIRKAFGVSDFSDLEMEKLEDALAQSMMDKGSRNSSEEAYLLYGGYEPLSVTLTHIVNQQAGLAWTSYSHTGVPVSTFALGVGEDMFNGYYDNTDIFKKVCEIMGLNAKVAMK